MIEHYEGLLSRYSTDNQPPLLMVVGLGQGYLLDAIERRGLSTKVLAIEPIPELVDEMFARRDWATWRDTGRLTLLLGPGFAGATDAWKLLGDAAGTPPMIVSPALEKEHPDAVKRAKAVAKQIVLGAKSNEEARRKLAGCYLTNTLKNLAVVASEGDAAQLTGAFSNIPAV